MLFAAQRRVWGRTAAFSPMWSHTRRHSPVPTYQRELGFIRLSTWRVISFSPGWTSAVISGQKPV